MALADPDCLPRAVQDWEVRELHSQADSELERRKLCHGVGGSKAALGCSNDRS